MKFSFTVTKSQVTKAYDQQLETAISTTVVKGFRKGKAPKKLVESQLGQSKLQQLAVESILPQSYSKAIQTKKITPISFPKINLKTVEKNGDFIFEAEVAQKPDIKLGNYQQVVRLALSKFSPTTKIWKPGDPQTPPSSDTNQHDQKLTLLFNTLVNTVTLKVPTLLVNQEVDRLLSRLLEQIDNLGLTLDDYIRSINKTLDELKSEYQKSAIRTLKLEFILQAIASDLNLTVTEAEVDRLIDSVPDPKTKNQLHSPNQRINLKVILLKRKVVDHFLGSPQP